MPLFYYYTDAEGAENIILSGKIKASLSFMAGGDIAFGNGVYFTKLSSETSIKIQSLFLCRQFTGGLGNLYLFSVPSSFFS